nr:unnamed protein product [Callosobruchus chinensis]
MHTIAKSAVKELDIIELKAFIGLLIYSAVFKTKHEDLDSLFATDGTGRDIFRTVIGKNRFAILLYTVRFDNSQTRDERKKENPAAAICDIFYAFIQNCNKIYSVGQTTCVDEMLVAFRGLSKFKMYMPNKPAKYGLKLMCITDARNGYRHKAYLYTGKYMTGTHIGRNSEKNIREISQNLLPNKNRAVGSTLYGFTNKMTLVSHVPKKNKSCQSMHHQKSQEDVKPEVIHFYNTIKGGVDSLDQKCANYSCGRRTKRWTMAIFCRISNISAVNTYILYNAQKTYVEMTHFKFKKQLRRELVIVIPHSERRVTNSSLMIELRA